MSLLALPTELLQLITKELADGREGRLYPQVTVRNIYAFSRTCRVLWEKLAWLLYRYDAERLESSALVWAVLAGSINTAKLSLIAGGDTRVANQYGQPALWLAARRGNKELVNILLDAGAAIEIRNPVGLTPLAIASREGQCEIIKLLLDRGADIGTETPDHSTPLLWAIRNAKPDAVKLLLDRGAQLPEPDTTPWRRWALAALRVGPAQWADLPQIKTLMESSYDPTQEAQLVDRPLLHLIQHQHLAMTRFYLDKCMSSADDLRSPEPEKRFANACGYADLCWPNNGQERDWNFARHWLSRQSTEGYPSVDPLWWAIYHGEEEVVEDLLRRGANMDQCSRQYRHDRKPNRPLSLALVRGFLGIAELLLDYGADADFKLWDCMLVERVLVLGHERLLQKVLRNSKTNWPSNFGLRTAIGKQNATLVRILLEHGADPSHEFTDWDVKSQVWGRIESALGHAMRRGNQDVVDTLIEFGAKGQ